MVMMLASFTYDQLCIAPDISGASIGLCIQLVISLLHMLLYYQNCQDVPNQCHPILLRVLKPGMTGGDGNCLFNVLSLTIAGNKHLSASLLLLCVYRLVKHRNHAHRITIHIKYFSESVVLCHNTSDWLER